LETSIPTKTFSWLIESPLFSRPCEYGLFDPRNCSGCFKRGRGDPGSPTVLDVPGKGRSTTSFGF
jgi:hypothetical protein